jgi:uncharacterized membrane protein
MTIRASVALIMFSLMFAFVGLNWSEFTTPTTLSVGLTVVQVPIGLVMLAILMLVVALFVVYIMYLHTAELLRTRRQLKEIETQRKLVDQVEASCITELRNFIGDQLSEHRKLDGETLAGVNAKLDANAAAILRLVEDQSNALGAQLGEMEDRLDQLLPKAGTPLMVR